MTVLAFNDRRHCIFIQSNSVYLSRGREMRLISLPAHVTFESNRPLPWLQGWRGLHLRYLCIASIAMQTSKKDIHLLYVRQAPHAAPPFWLQFAALKYLYGLDSEYFPTGGGKSCSSIRALSHSWLSLRIALASVC